MGRVKDREFWQSARFNNATFMQYYDRLVELSVSMFEWTNLPETIDPRFLELSLFTHGKVAFFEDPALGYLVLPWTLQAQLDVYRNPKRIRVYSNTGYNRTLKPVSIGNMEKANAVVIYNNALRTPSMLPVENFAKRLYDLDRTIDVNTNAQKTPILITCEESEKLTFMNVYKEYEGNSPVVFGKKNFKAGNFEVLNTGAPFVADKIYQLKTQIWNEALTYLGISNVSFQKKERMVSDEAIRTQGGTIASRYSRLNARRLACDQINKLFGLTGDNEISCDFREDFREADDEVMFQGETGNYETNILATDLRTR